MASKSLGTLTLDLVAKTSSFVAGMDKATRASDKWRKEVTRHTKQAAIAFASFTGAAATAAIAIGVSTQKAAVEIGKLSAVAGASAEEFQRYAVGAEAAGISNEKFADILKDVNDKVGDFLATGGGGMVIRFIMTFQIISGSGMAVVSSIVPPEREILSSF